MSSKSFSLEDYDCVGFDLDNTIVFYDILNMSKLLYNNFTKYLIEQKGYAGKKLLKSFESGLDFLQKGLTMDFERGNIVKLGPGGAVLLASHGTKLMTATEITDVYGPGGIWNDGEKYCSGILESWNGPLGEKVRSVLCYFDAVVTLIFARAVDTFDEDKTGKDYYSIWKDILSALENMYNKDGFENNTGDYFPALKSEPLKYIKPCPESVITLLKKLKERGKFVFLATGSAADFASFTSTTAIGESWSDLFDLVIFMARKPNFFIADRPFLQIDGLTEGDPVKLSKNSKFFAQGNWKELRKFLETRLGKNDLKIVYIGDNAVQDILAPVKHNCCETVCITQEENHPNEPIIGSSVIWGDYLTYDGKDTFWKQIVDQHALLSVDCLSRLLDYI